MEIKFAKTQLGPEEKNKIIIKKRNKKKQKETKQKTPQGYRQRKSENKEKKTKITHPVLQGQFGLVAGGWHWAREVC